MKWTVRNLGEMKCRKEFERKIAEKFMNNRYCQRSSVELAWDELKGAVVEVASKCVELDRREVLKGQSGGTRKCRKL